MARVIYVLAAERAVPLISAMGNQALLSWVGVLATAVVLPGQGQQAVAMDLPIALSLIIAIVGLLGWAAGKWGDRDDEDL